MKRSEVSIKTRSTPASLSFKGQATKHTTVKWSIFSNLIGALSALFFTNYCVGLKSDSEIGQLAVIGYLNLHSYMNQSVHSA